jgi:hypothetical protein
VEDIRFDTLAKVLGSHATRRLTLGALIGGALGRLGLHEAEAKSSFGTCKPACSECRQCDKGKCHKKHGRKHCTKGTCEPTANGTLCTGIGDGICANGTCINPKTDEANCGTIGNACGPTQVCQEGRCFSVSICPATLTTACPAGPTSTTICSSGGAGCFCTSSTEGNAVCAEVPTGAKCTTFTPCTSSVTCPTGQACVEVGSCCSGGVPAHACFASCSGPTA